MVRGIMPYRMIAETAFAAVSILLKTAVIVLTASGSGKSLRVIRVITPSVPSDPIKSRVRS